MKPAAPNLRLIANTVPLKPPRRMDPLYGEITGYSDLGMDVVGNHGSAVRHYREIRDADERHDYALDQALLSLLRGEYAMVRYWIEQAQHHDRIEDTAIERVWKFFGDAAEAGRQLVGRIEKLFGRGGR